MWQPVTPPKAFLERMKQRSEGEYSPFLASYEHPPYRALRVNTLKISVEEFMRRSPFPLLGRVPWQPNGFYMEAQWPGADPYHFAGLFYMQEPSAMAVGEITAPLPKRRVLDLCAAPGSKTTLLAEQMAGSGILIANEVDFMRAKILSDNVERMGITNCSVTWNSADDLCALFPHYFDLILVDAPCSGEGMFRKLPAAINEWSEENVARCAARQEMLLERAAVMLETGGHLLYSTCTFAEEEDEWQVQKFLQRHKEFCLVRQQKLYPHTVKGEGHFFALLQKTDCACGEEGIRSPVARLPLRRDRLLEGILKDFLADFLSDGISLEQLGGELYLYPFGGMRLVPEGMPDLAKLNVLRLGLELGEWNAHTFKPAHAFAMAHGRRARRQVSLTREQSEGYLRGHVLLQPVEKGWCTVCVEEFPLGLGKCSNDMVKNHLPHALRMRRPESFPEG